MATITPISAPSTTGQNGFFNLYPYTDFHEMNLDWLLTNYQAIIDKTNQIITWVNQHQIDYEEAMERLAAVENEIDTFEQRVNDEFAALTAQIEADFAEQKRLLQLALAQTREEIERELVELQQEVDRVITEFRNEFEQLKTQVLNELAQVKAEVERTIVQLNNLLIANNEYVFQWVNNRLQEFIDSLPEILTVQVYNPYRGVVTDIQTAINDIYSVACTWGLTALQYDSLGLTAAEYDAKELSAMEYDTMGYKLLYKDPDYHMTSPFTGEYVHIQDVIMDLAHLHMGGVTAEYYDGLELTAQEYDSKELTAFQYDWYADELLTA